MPKYVLKLTLDTGTGPELEVTEIFDFEYTRKDFWSCEDELRDRASALMNRIINEKFYKNGKP